MNMKKIIRMSLSVLLFFAFLYVMVQFYRIYNNTYKTEIVISYSMSDSILCDGVVSFESQNVEGSGNIGYLVQNGERVSQGTRLAEIYTDSNQAVCREKLQDLEKQIDLLEKSQNANGTDLDVLVNQMQAALYDLMDAMDSGRYDEMKENEQEYLLAANRLQISTGQESDYREALSALEAEREAVLAEFGSPDGIYAGDNGYFVSGESASYLNYSDSTLAEASPVSLQQLLNGDIEAGNFGYLGKIVSSYHWVYYGICTLEQADKFENVSSVKISFPGKAETPIPAVVAEVVRDEERGIAKVTLNCEYVSADVLSLGHQKAKIDFVTYEGLRIPAAALHIVNDERCVYVKYGNLARLRSLETLYQNDEYILAPNKAKMDPEDALKVKSQIKLYDEVIVSGKDLYDGKLL